MVIIPNFKIVVKQPLTPDFPFPEGYVLPVDKPLGWTSSDVVRKIRVIMRKIGYRKIKVGHAGTLDPLATGVLIICIGRATKRVDELQAEEKELAATEFCCDQKRAVFYTPAFRQTKSCYHILLGIDAMICAMKQSLEQPV